MSIKEKIEAWYAAHFSYLTPGTPEHHTHSEALKNLKALLCDDDQDAPPAAQQAESNIAPTEKE